MLQKSCNVINSEDEDKVILIEDIYGSIFHDKQYVQKRVIENQIEILGPLINKETLTAEPRMLEDKFEKIVLESKQKAIRSRLETHFIGKSLPTKTRLRCHSLDAESDDVYYYSYKNILHMKRIKSDVNALLL